MEINVVDLDVEEVDSMAGSVIYHGTFTDDVEVDACKTSL